jgi:molybdopterin biosynthesis enzyme
MVGFQALLGVDEALRRVLEYVPAGCLEVVDVPLEQCAGRVCGVDVASPTDIPEFDRSAIDGYAVRARDVFGASAIQPYKAQGYRHARFQGTHRQRCLGLLRTQPLRL